MDTLSLSVKTIIKSLNKDFGEPMSTQIILHNSKKCSLDLTHLDSDGYSRLVDSIISDYSDIKPLGCDISLKARELLSVINA
jgi:hypothetical protein